MMLIGTLNRTASVSRLCIIDDICRTYRYLYRYQTGLGDSPKQWDVHTVPGRHHQILAGQSLAMPLCTHVLCKRSCIQRNITACDTSKK